MTRIIKTKDILFPVNMQHRANIGNKRTMLMVRENAKV